MPSIGSWDTSAGGHADDLCRGNVEDACSGDSGGPLVAELGGRQFVIGIVSRGVDCAKHQGAGIYTRVRALSTWISTMRAKHADPGEIEQR